MNRLFAITAVMFLGSLQSQAQDMGFNFRATSGYATDPPYAVSVTAETYPHLFTNGAGLSMTGGWERSPSTCFLQQRDKSTAIDPRLAGLHMNSGNGAAKQFQCIFRIDLPRVGNWTISLASGSATTTSTSVYLQLRDNGSPFQTVASNVNLALGTFLDANGVQQTGASWPLLNTPFVHTFTSKRFEVVVGPNSPTGTGSSPITHVRITAGGDIPLVISPTNPVIGRGGTKTFNATQGGGVVAGGVTWSCSGCAGSIDSSTGVYTAPSTINANQSYGGCQVGPNDSVFNTRVDSLPVNPSSASWISNAGAGPVRFEPSFPINYADGTTPTQSMVFFYTPGNNGSYLIPRYPSVAMQGGWLASPSANEDRHLFVITPSTCRFQEMYAYYPAGFAAHAGCALCTSQSGLQYQPTTSYALSSTGTTDAAGLPIMPLLLHLQELENAVATGGTIKHALRMTLQNGYIRPAFIWPATANASPFGKGPPYGARFRLKSSFNISGFSSVAQILLTQMKQYGVIVADGGTGWAISTDYAPWPLSYLAAFHEIFRARIATSNWEGVDESTLEIAANSVATKSGERVTAASVSMPASTSSTSVLLKGVTLNLARDALYIQAGTPVQQLTAFVNGSTDTSTTWRMSPSVGTLTKEGLYTPPSTTASTLVTIVTAASVADNTVSARMTLSVLPDGPIRIITGSTSPYTDSNGNVWQPVILADGGAISDATGIPPAWPTTPDIFIYKHLLGSLAQHDMRFDLTVPNGNYAITAKFAASSGTGPHQRSMALEAQGKVIFSNVDTWAAAGGKNLPIDFVLPALVTNNQLSFVLRYLYCTDTSINCQAPVISGLQIVSVDH